MSSREKQAEALATTAQAITAVMEALAKFADITEKAIAFPDSVWGDTWAERMRDEIVTLGVIRDEMRAARLELDIKASR